MHTNNYAHLRESIRQDVARLIVSVAVVKPRKDFWKTFVTLSLAKGMRQETVMSIAGNKDHQTMWKYLKITNDDSIRDE